MSGERCITQSCGNVYCTTSNPCSSCCAPCCVAGPAGPDGPTGPPGVTGPSGATFTALTFTNSGPTGAVSPNADPAIGDIYFYEPTDQLFRFVGADWMDVNGNNIPV